MRLARTSLCTVAFTALMSLGAASHAQTPPGTTVLAAQLSGAAESPAVASAGSGTVEARFDKETSVLSWTVTYTGLSGPATAGHFHGPAMPGQNAGVVVPLGAKLDSPIQGKVTLTGAQAEELLMGRWYLNLHTAAHPGGEVRGQVTAKP